MAHGGGSTQATWRVLVQTSKNLNERSAGSGSALTPTCASKFNAVDALFTATRW